MMMMKEENEIVKIRMITGRIITLDGDLNVTGNIYSNLPHMIGYIEKTLV